MMPIAVLISQSMEFCCWMTSVVHEMLVLGCLCSTDLTRKYMPCTHRYTNIPCDDLGNRYIQVNV